MTKGKETAKDAEKGNGVKITRGECYFLNLAIGDLSSSTPTLKGKIVFALAKNEGKLKPIVDACDKERFAIMDEFIKKDKNGNMVVEELSEEEKAAGKIPQYKYKSKNGFEVSEKKLGDYMAEEVEVELHKIWMNDFENIDISTPRNQRIGILIKYLVTEQRDMQLMR